MTRKDAEAETALAAAAPSSGDAEAGVVSQPAGPPWLSTVLGVGPSVQTNPKRLVTNLFMAHVVSKSFCTCCSNTSSYPPDSPI